VVSREADLERIRQHIENSFILTVPHMNTSGMNYVREYLKYAYSHTQNELNREKENNNG
jgi:hypothetical protein